MFNTNPLCECQNCSYEQRLNSFKVKKDNQFVLSGSQNIKCPNCGLTLKFAEQEQIQLFLLSIVIVSLTIYFLLMNKWYFWLVGLVGLYFSFRKKDFLSLDENKKVKLIPKQKNSVS